MTVLVERLYERADLSSISMNQVFFNNLETCFVQAYSIHQTIIAIWIQIIRPDKALLPRSRYSKRPHTGHDVANGLARFEEVCKPLVLALQPTIPEDLAVVEAEDRAAFPHLGLHVIFAGKDFVVEHAEFVLGAEGLGFIDDGADAGAFGEDDGADEMAVGELFFTEVQMCCRC